VNRFSLNIIFESVKR